MSISVETLALAKKYAGGGGSSITVDSELSDISTNPVQNKVIKAAVDEAKSIAYNAYYYEDTYGGCSIIDGYNAECSLPVQCSLSSYGTFDGSGTKSINNPIYYKALYGIDVFKHGLLVINTSYAMFPYEGDYFTVTKQSDSDYYNVVLDEQFSGNSIEFPTSYNDDLHTEQPISYLREKELLFVKNYISGGVIDFFVYITHADGSVTELSPVIRDGNTYYTIPSDAIGLRSKIRIKNITTARSFTNVYAHLEVPGMNDWDGTYREVRKKYDWTNDIGPIYGMWFDLNTGKLYSNIGVLYGSDKTWSITETTNTYIKVECQGPDNFSYFDHCSHFDQYWGWGTITPNTFNASLVDGNLVVYLDPSIGTTDADVNAWMNEHDPAFYYAYSDNPIYQLEPYNIELIQASNVIGTNGYLVNVSVRYAKNTTRMIGSKLNATYSTSDAGKFIIIDEYGYAVPTTIEEWNGGSF